MELQLLQGPGGRALNQPVIYVFLLGCCNHCYINICLFFVIVVCKIMIQSLESLYY